MRERYDVVVVGGGSAGCVLAARLSEDPDRSVLLVEAGPDYGDDPSAWPPEMLNPIHYDVNTHSWGYADAAVDGRADVPLPRARVLGGSSTVNGTIWARGAREDYDSWASAGNDGWSFDEIVPYFMRAERDLETPDGLHGREGPMRVERIDPRVMSPYSRALIESALENGYPWTDDPNDPDEGPSIGLTPCNIGHGVRWNTAIAYLNPARNRPNLDIVSDTLTDQVLFEGSRAVGIQTSDGRTFQAGEVILSAGAYGSPAILLRSGIGPADHLRDVGITVHHDLSGVGSHLMDHPSILMSYRIHDDHLPASPLRLARVETIMKAKSGQVPDGYDLHVISHGNLYDDEFECWALVFRPYLEYSRSTGTVRLTDSDPEAPLAIDHNYLSDERDLEALADGVEMVNDLCRTPPLAKMLDGALRPGPDDYATREALKAHITAHVTTTFHPACTCRMGPAGDAGAVVDNQGWVHGVDGLRVCDASIFPYIPRANLNWPAIAAAERIADWIRAGIYLS